MKLETIDCPVCGGSEYRDWGRENGFTAVKCAGCGAVYVRNRPALDAISAAARDGVHEVEEGTLDQRLRRQGWKVWFYARIVARFFRPDERVSWLDVGSGNGEFVEAVARALPNATIKGIDPMLAKVERAKARGVPVEALTLEQVDSRFDVISIINVFSHIPDFDGFVKAVRDRLMPDGALFIETGNGGDLGARTDYPGDLLLPDHLIFVGVDQMKQILARHGFAVTKVFSRRVDHPFWAAKQLVKSLLRGKPRLVLPYTHPFRTVFYLAKLQAQR
jgi:2-polyprenyl-3-methyl-5-hydroxy-6-metoxy-1,4-benzoquinol methylase